jgi:hypothetical protein
MKIRLFWNDSEKRLRAGWRILIQIVIVSIPLVIFGASGLYSSEWLAIKITATALPITLFSIWFMGRFVDKRAYSDYGIQIQETEWWLDYGFGLLFGFLAASAFSSILMLMGWANTAFSDRFDADHIAFLIAFLISSLAYSGVGVFEEVVPTYQIRNITEGLSGTPSRRTAAMIPAVILAGSYSVVMHLDSKDPSFLIYIMVTGVIYGLFFI